MSYLHYYCQYLLSYGKLVIQDARRFKCSISFLDVVCSRLDIESDSVANTFPGTFQYVSMFNQRPYYRNTDQDVFMYFNTGTGCNYWAVGPQVK